MEDSKKITYLFLWLGLYALNLFSAVVPAVSISIPANKRRCRHKVFYILLVITAAATIALLAALEQTMFPCLLYK